MLSSEYIIRIKSRRFVFPTRCPVCGKSADQEGSIPAISARDREAVQDTTSHSLHSFSGKRSSGFSNVTPLRIPTCERHAMKFEDMKRFGVPCGIIGVLLVIIAIIQALFILRSYVSELEIGLLDFIFLFLLLFGVCVATTLSGPTTLQRKIKVLDMSPDFEFMILLIKNSEYAEELLHLNPMIAERVSPIHRNE
ncbi:MAG: hypothetical protein ACTSU3_09555 [Candidatus Thorarchaeota archaeon]